ncbi:uncharacterized protein LOC113240348 [Hyposmocoma kahamanoa]|uniref:uncharacterized protein LOC113240348 n=1 Tax=Hyposmocoma kahamanoa TaxID=1477025 RepID=UPI000E6D9BDB|nr:uncharacterized protein LOC113240348 [Hyposmocoma kahamanoa]
MFRPWEGVEQREDVTGQREDAPVRKEDAQVDRKVNTLCYKHYNTQAQQIVLNVYSAIRSEIGLYGAMKRTSELTKVSIDTVKRIVRRGTVKAEKRTKERFRKVDNFTADVMVRKIHDFYENNVVPTADMLFKEINKDEPMFPYSSRHLLNYLRSIGFKYGTLDKRRVIMASSRLIQLRDEYLARMREYRRQSKSIVYLDETWYDTHDVVKRGFYDCPSNCSLDTPVSSNNRIIILHAGTESGWIENALLLSARNIKNCSADYHQDMDAKLFETWFEYQLIPNIPPNSVIVLDNATYHRRQIEKIPNTGTRKDKIVRFLRDHYIDVPSRSTKKILLDLMKENNFEKRFFIDELATSKGHQILRLPPYYCIFNPCELLWGLLKEYVRNNQPNFSDNVTQILKNGITATNHHWRTSCEHVRSLENKYSRLRTHSPLIINLGSDNSSANSSSDSE